jgi:hypothetical protein
LFRIGNCSNEKNDPASTLTNYINSITLSGRTISMNGATPEDQALKYLIEEDTTFDPTQISTLNSKVTNEVHFRISQRYALMTLWFQQAFTNTSWFLGNGWLVSADECNFNWYGISCISMNLGGNVGLQNVVTDVNLQSNNMKGSIPADIGLLFAMQAFGAFDNALTGTLPASIGQWTTLTYFSVYNNALTGTIPESIDNWSQIQIAYFDKNQFDGIMPNAICSYINQTIDTLEADCVSEISCTCCTQCY